MEGANLFLLLSSTERSCNAERTSASGAEGCCFWRSRMEERCVAFLPGE